MSGGNLSERLLFGSRRVRLEIRAIQRDHWGNRTQTSEHYPTPVSVEFFVGFRTLQVAQI